MNPFVFFKCSSSFRISVHVISIIMNLGQNVEEDWPLFVRDNMGEDHAVIMKPGDMVLYEARTIHARQIPLREGFIQKKEKLLILITWGGGHPKF